MAGWLAGIRHEEERLTLGGFSACSLYAFNNVWCSVNYVVIILVSECIFFLFKSQHSEKKGNLTSLFSLTEYSLPADSLVYQKSTIGKELISSSEGNPKKWTRVSSNTHEFWTN